MTRTLRPRKSRPSYSALLNSNSDNELEIVDSAAGTSKLQVAPDDDAEGESDFEPDKDDDPQEMEVDGDEDENSAYDDEEDRKKPDLAAGPSKVSVRTKKKTAVSKPSLSGFSSRRMYTLPTPSMHHRHRAIPLHTVMGRTERLETRPSLFKAWRSIVTDGPTRNPQVFDRVNKAWSYNVGCGPLWELVEDRGWYKEATRHASDVNNIPNRRPKVYQDVPVPNGWKVLNNLEAAPYLPTDSMTTEDGSLQPPPPVSCFLGKFDHQTEKKFEIYQTQKMSEFIPESAAHIFNAGAPVWGLDWCPIHPGDRESRSYKQYLAVAPFPTRSHSPEIGVRVTRPSYACIQIWSFGPDQQLANQQDLDNGEVKCEMVLCLEGGPAHELKWCPLPAHDDPSSTAMPRKLGLLGGIFEDGSWSLYAVPDPADINQTEHNLSEPVYVRLPEPLLRIELEETACLTFDWANSELICIGTANGVIAVYEIGSSLRAVNTRGIDHGVVTDLLPTHYITVHQSAIRAIAWIRAPAVTSAGAPRVDANPAVIVSGGYDGVECLTDIREGHGSIMNRTRDVINAMAFSTYGGGPVTIDHENIVKAYSASPTMLGRGHTLLDPQGPVWSIHASDFHPQLVIGSADGSCITTNSLRATRRGGSVPFLIHKIYQLDYSRNSGVYRMLEQFYPQETQDRPAAKVNTANGKNSKKDQKKGRIKADVISTGAWPREVGVHRVVWNSSCGLGAAGLLASATASGLCRIDDLWGRWIKDKIPYGGIENIRGNSEGNAMDVDHDQASDDSIGSS